ncbi:DNA (cytosine-5-)-methyltransferase [Brevibacillus borstelensis]|uniref:DNA (cytosine-5-)-methyltransferase n=1 Tax=Brevibacillus gelatini TaxID=1655277 RepID=A0A3M8BF26_9BACL|nr:MULTISPECIES: DNA (cytosine-5-)-methyltransferase [Brevibacillus]MBE5395205.1 DNA (cytosine-5-)-methyltransferase [Brevibacillus borstelensis]RNB62028.1 DNA (cytosine-5-)-methyltransferase [Brevibacillus gelatini]
MLKVASFFSGIGGFDLGLERAGMEVVFQCEKDAFCQKVLRKHWPNVKLMGDINDVTINEVPEAEVWCGGFPCQDVSLANQGKRKGLKGDRSGLFYKYAELIEQRRPRWVLVENVPGLLNSNNGNDFRVVISTLDELGYCVAWRILDAKYFGTPQRRRRVYIVASYQSRSAAEVLFEQGSIAIAHRQGLGQREISATGFGKGNQSANLYSIQHAGIGRKPSAGPQAKGYRNDGETYTLDSRGSSDAVCQTDAPFRVRDTTGVSGGMDGSRFRTLGNAVAVPVIEWIGKRIMAIEEGRINI